MCVLLLLTVERNRCETIRLGGLTVGRVLTPRCVCCARLARVQDHVRQLATRVNVNSGRRRRGVTALYSDLNLGHCTISKRLVSELHTSTLK